jgi:hypothetical protein
VSRFIRTNILFVDRRHLAAMPKLAEGSVVVGGLAEVKVGFGANKIMDRDRCGTLRKCCFGKRQRKSGE